MIVSPFISVKVAFAYLDPGTGSYVFQVLIAIVVGSLFAIKMFWAKVTGVLKKTFTREKDKK